MTIGNYKMHEIDLHYYIINFKKLDDLLRNEWLNIKELLEAQNINLSNTHLISFIESEDGMQYGILFTNQKEVITFEIDAEINECVELKQVQDLSELEQLKIDNPSVEAAFIHFK